MRIVDEPFPADGGARFFEIDAHDDFHAVGQFASKGGKPGGVFEGAVHIVDGAGPDDDEKARVFLAQNAGNGLAALGHGGVDGIG